MSFSNLKSARSSRTAKSFVNQDVSEILSPQDTSSSSQTEAPVKADLDGLYECLPSHVEVKSTASMGRGLFTNKTILPGEVIINTKPHVACLSTQNLPFFCASCFSQPPPGQDLKRCTKCRVLYYCGATCQNNDWSIHKHECAALRKWSKDAPSKEHAIPNDAIRSLGRILWRRRNEGEDSKWTKEIDGLQSNRKKLPPSAAEMHTHLAHAIVQYLGASSPVDLAEYGISSVADLVDVISRFISNTFAIATSSLTPLGASVSPPIALTNHSCDPNAVIVFPRASTNPVKDEPAMKLIAIKTIPAGEQVLTSYIDTTLPMRSRRETLKETYNFDCLCSLCSATDFVDPRDAIRCPKGCGGLCRIPEEDNSTTSCSRCGTPVDDVTGILDLVRVGTEGFDKASDLQSSDPTGSIRLTSHLIPLLQSAGLTPSTHPLLALTRLHQSLLINTLPDVQVTQDLLDEIIRTAMKNVSGLMAILVEGHPVRAIALAELGKVLSMDEPNPRHAQPSPEAAADAIPSGPTRLRLACDSLIRALQELVIGFGKADEGGEVGREMRKVIVDLEKELGVWKYGVNNVLRDDKEAIKGRT